MESSHNAPIIHAFNLAQKRFFHPVVNRQKPRTAWGKCTPFSTRILAVSWLKKSFLSKVKGMNDHGIRRTFPLYALVLPKYEI